MLYTDRIYGAEEINDPAVLSVLKTPQMQRLKGVNQFGAYKYTHPYMDVSRFEHCVGVYLLLRRFGANREEQLAGLIHDISHTAFSHVIDYVFGQSETQTIHEALHHHFLFDSPVAAIAEQYRYNIHSLIDGSRFSLLEQELPALCADRLDYFFRDSVVYRVISQHDVQSFLNDLTTHNGIFHFSTPQIAVDAALKFMKMGIECWGSPHQQAIFQLLADAIKIGLQHNIIDMDDLFLTDDEVYKLLYASGRDDIISRLSLLTPSISIAEDDERPQLIVKGKARYIDPPVLINGVSVLTSNLYPELQENIKAMKERFAKPFCLRIHGLNTPPSPPSLQLGESYG